MNAADHGAAIFTGRTRDAMITDTELRSRVRQWNTAADQARRKIDWTFTVRDAERIFGSDWFNRIVSEH
ncbi:hypothetical protein [Sorangium atrum]|uniref:Transposase n=1 Tax=Sorangium atrum TaxID=2995308 RepID=A0ABT5CIE1_9BACT|nr:hypothetical protein [Sorangium aterium]MDC0685600.1 hypothetical protein [Sorangium aterium]